MVNKAIYGLKELSLLWSKGRDSKLKKLKIEVPRSEDNTVKDQRFEKKPQGDPNIVLVCKIIIKSYTPIKWKGRFLNYGIDIRSQ